MERVHDAKMYFRILDLVRTERLKASAMLGGQFVDEARLTMGYRASPQTAQRISLVGQGMYWRLSTRISPGICGEYHRVSSRSSRRGWNEGLWGVEGSD